MLDRRQTARCKNGSLMPCVRRELPELHPCSETGKRSYILGFIVETARPCAWTRLNQCGVEPSGMLPQRKLEPEFRLPSGYPSPANVGLMIAPDKLVLGKGRHALLAASLMQVTLLYHQWGDRYAPASKNAARRFRSL